MILKKTLNQIPFLRVFFPFLIGIILQTSVKLKIDIFVLIYILVSLFLFALAINMFFDKYKFRWMFGFCVTLLFAVLGILNVSLNTNSLDITHLNKIKTFNLYVVSPIIEKKKTYQVKANVFYQNKKIGKSIIYFEKDSRSDDIRIGDHIVAKTKFTVISSPKNPNIFNYKKYLSNKNIFVQGYIKSNYWKCIDHKQSCRLLYYSENIKNKLLSILRENVIGENEFQILSALILGEKSTLNSEIKQSFADSGVIHVLAVSGLHVGIIYLLFSNLLGFVFRENKFKWLNTIILIIILFIYAMVTGLSPSIQRATLMFSFIIIGKSLKRQINIFNSVFLSAFILLLINPNLIFYLGFQLSYIAVLGIILFFSKINNLLTFKYNYLNKIWSLIAVSIAAQIATFPLILYYFHQFPVYFLLANIVVIPIAWLLIICGISLLCFAPIPVIASKIGVCINFITKLLLGFTETVQNIKYSKIDEIYFKEADLIIVYSIIFSVLLLMYFRKVIYLKGILVLVFVLIIIHIVGSYIVNKQVGLIVYNIKNKSVYNFISASNSYLYSNNLNFSDNLFNYEVAQGLLGFGIKKRNVHFLNTHNDLRNDIQIAQIDNIGFLVFFRNIKILIINNSCFNENVIKRINYVDFIIMSNDAGILFESLYNNDFSGKLIFDTSNSNYNIRKWINECDRCKLKYFNVNEKKAFQNFLLFK